MIIGPHYHGDDDREMIVLQHDVYHKALGIIVEECRRFYVLANALAGVKEELPTCENLQVDHRTLQNAHDILAAVWRYKTNCIQLKLPLVDSAGQQLPETKILTMNDWLMWLTSEVKSWADSPWLVRFVWTIIENQNTKPGYDAEESLTEGLYERFRDVPWV